MKKRKFISLLVIVILIIIICFAILLVKSKNTEDTEKADNTETVGTTLEQREFWNKLLYNSPYIGEIEYIYPDHQIIDNTDMLRIALATDDVETEYINYEDIQKNELLTKGDGYKKSRKNIDKYLEELLGLSLYEYERVQTYVENGEYIIYDEDYVYFTKIKVPEKMYIATNYKEEDNNYEVTIFEYVVTDENKTQLEEMLQTGVINNDIEKNRDYVIKGTKENDNVKINYKYTDEEQINEMDELTRGG